MCAAADDASPDAIFLDLMAAILAVNNWPLEKTIAATQKFDDVGLGSPSSVSALDLETVANRLTVAGFNRGDYMNRKMAGRVLGTARTLVAGGLDTIRAHEGAGETSQLREFLLSLDGVGPDVVRIFFALRGHTADAV
jgi:hypothetical protein